MTNKIKEKLPERQDFSPWEESFINLVRSFDPTRRGHAPSLRKQYLTIDCCKGHTHERVIPVRRELGRSLLNTSKINLKSRDGSMLEEELLVQQKSSRYQGPRLTFYSKMNPKCSEASRASIKGATQTHRHSFYNEQQSLLRDSSIKYLPQQPSQLQKNREEVRYLRSIYPITSERSAVAPQRRDQEWPTMRRLKILYNSRRMSNQ